MSKAMRRIRRLDEQKESRPMTFRCWLKSQRDREDAVGGLARKVLASSVISKNSLNDYRAQLHESGTPDRLMRALDDAWAAYMQSIRL
jgi:hypothetical protein